MMNPFWKAVFATIAILVLSLIPGDFGQSEWSIPHFDKFVHLGMYLVYALLIASAFENQYKFRKFQKSHKAYALIYSILFSAAIELIQEFLLSYRTGDWTDLLANAIGAFIGVLIYARS